ncbi:MAG TPA: Maf family nucleotide pyrophosphatase [Verrucomicrobiae bacterium]|jgi:septum formation protein|nr:Maf family nucleotide pyrophosphatase [Verrucomicrobiae bacterium]
MRVVLASESVFRRRAMDLLGIPYETCPAGIDEKVIRDRDPAQLTIKLAEAKARHIAPRFPNAVIVAGDAVAAKGGRIFEKPQDLEEAAAFLREFSGSEFQFVTSIAVLHTGTDRMISTAETCNIFFRPLSEPEIQRYVRKYDVLSYAGAFENDAVVLFADRISGSYNLGTALPPSRLAVVLRKQGVEV